MAEGACATTSIWRVMDTWRKENVKLRVPDSLGIGSLHVRIEDVNMHCISAELCGAMLRAAGHRDHNAPELNVIETDTSMVDETVATAGVAASKRIR